MLPVYPRGQTTMQFAEALHEHLAALAAKDAEAFLATVHDEVTLILPTGALLTGKDAVAAFHRDWFGDPDWRMDVEVLRTTTAGGTGVAVLRVEYHDLDAAGAPYELRYLLALVFAQRADGGWLLLHDQNTSC